MALDRSELDHPSWRTVAGTGASYLVVLTVMFVLLFVVPFALFYLL
ncbi:hypothetical protein [Halosegnis marinus]|uniref:ABC transporter permease n=1 Tax=Halosegnis marinus TaxID=3034023 RepID=A0ABD5ZQK7_9EURY|nr:hypothetical protein [Halosegnis sp. DT85]